ncbi:MAG: serine/threonine protein kinase [Caldimonas sp.]
MNPAHEIESTAGPAGARPPHGHMLAIGTRLRDYEITGLIGEAAFAIVYLAWDHSLQRKVAVKEYMPASLASRGSGGTAIRPRSERHADTFKAGLKSFVNEARLLARFDHASLVKVYRFWEENGTAYMVMPLYEGPTLEAALAELDHVPSEAELRAWLKPILNAVALLHEGELWHENIGPDNIVLTPIGPVLFGLGAARRTIAAIEHTPSTALKPGFAAIEQYGSAAETTRGAWTDLYGLAAVVYAAITGQPPVPAADRLAEDRLRPLSVVAAGLYSERFLAAIDAALAVEPERRPRDHLQFRALMGDIDAPTPVALTPPRDLMHEPFGGGREGEREITVPDRPLMSLDAPAAKAAERTATPSAVAVPAAPQRARTAPRAGPDSVPPRSVEASPSWMRSGAVHRLFGKRTLYGLVAGTCAMIGIAALALQFYGRQASRGAMPVATSALPQASTAVATLAATVRTAARPGAALVAPPAPPPASRNGPSGTPPAATAAPPDVLTAPANDAERQARCTEILQKASLERITAGETDFFKRECK